MSNVSATFSFKRRVAVLFSGGDAPGMNPFLRAFVRLGLNRYEAEVWGVRDGYQGLVRAARRLVSSRSRIRENSDDATVSPKSHNFGYGYSADDTVAQIESRRGLAGLRDRSRDVVSLDHESVSGLSGRGGIVLGAGRCSEFYDEATRQQVLRWLAAMQIEALAVCGGDGSLTGAERLDAEGNRLVIGIPGSIDNDVACTERSLGVDTAVNTLIWAIERFHDTAGSHGRVMVLETMGRDSGELARLAALGSGAEILVTPERGPLTEEKAVGIGERIEESLRGGRSHAIVLISEGVAHDEVPGGSPAPALAARLQRYFRRQESWVPQTEVRASILGHLQRGGAPTGEDRVLAARFAEAAWDAITPSVARSGLIGLRLGRVGWQPFGMQVVADSATQGLLYELQKSLSRWPKPDRSTASPQDIALA